MNKAISSGLDKLLHDGPIAINIGVIEFADALDQQKAEVIHVEWQPPAGGDEELSDLLASIL